VAFESCTGQPAPGTYPSNFPDNQQGRDLSIGTNGGTTGMSATRSQNASSQASQSFTWDVSSPGVAFQFAVQPGSTLSPSAMLQMF